VVTNLKTTNKKENIFSFLSARESKIIKMRFGLDGDNKHSLEEVGKHFGVTRERIRQVEVKAIKRLMKLGLIILEKE